MSTSDTNISVVMLSEPGYVYIIYIYIYIYIYILTNIACMCIIIHLHDLIMHVLKVIYEYLESLKSMCKGESID